MNSADLNEISGIYFKDKVEKKEMKITRIQNINTVQWPAWELFPLNNYLTIGSGATVHNRRTIPMLTTRGCPYSCKFCSAAKMWGNKTTFRDVSDVVDEILYYVKHYSVEHIEFMDIVGLVNMQWTKDLCNAIIKENLKISFSLSPGTRSEVLTREVLELLKRINLIRVQYAADSGSTEEAKRLKKNINFKKFIKSVKSCNDVGLPMCCNILIGYPGQKMSDLWTTAKFALKLAYFGVHDVLIHNFVPYPGTEFYDELVADEEVKEKFLNFKFIAKTNSPSVGFVYSFSKDIPSLFLSIYRFVILLMCLLIQYIVYPRRIFLTIKNIYRKTPVTFFENLIYLKLYKELSNLKKNLVVNYKIDDILN